MKNWILFLAVLSIEMINYYHADAQIVKIVPGDNKVRPYNDDNETAPEFPGGTAAFFTYLKKNITYKKGNIDEKLIVQFTIKKDGSLGNFKIKKGKNRLNIQEVIRVLKLSPRWKPARIHSKITEVQYSLPILFTH
ncbi:MAG: hypothetical protein EOP47_04945 [Sphingobacteriaceae bacterium]|nr:MAG: hypothetical protein EOP47_04945 [Sphingobacteriaceae bacterium]